jgi:superfamily I DNA and/or RNA helicase
MTTQRLEIVEKKIGLLKQRLLRLGSLRPGTLSVQYRNPAKMMTPFNQISYTLNGKSHSEYVRPQNLLAVRREIANYRTFKTIIREMITLSVKASRLRYTTQAQP